MKKLLILGGTNFIGRNLIDRLVQLNKYSITLFNRGITNPNLFKQFDNVHGDRQTNDIEKIKSQSWDYIVDLSCFHPDSLQNVLNQINSGVVKYIFISTCSVYNVENKLILRNETSPTLLCNDNERVGNELTTYGQRKAECERILSKSGMNYSILRPALVYGQYDKTDRLYYWIYHTSKGTPLLLPNSGLNLFSVTYVHDLVEVIIQSFNKSASDIYNVVSIPKCSINNIIESISNTIGIEAKKISVDSKFLHDHKIREWIDVPLWLDSDYYTYDNSKLIRDYKFTPTTLIDSIGQTIEYFNRFDWDSPKIGIHVDKIRELIKETDKVTTANTRLPQAGL